MLLYMLLDISIAYILDLIFGDPYWLPHPVSAIGRLVKRTENLLRKYTSNIDQENKASRELIAGTVLAAFVILISFLVVFGVLKLALLINPILFHAVNIYFIYSALATKCLAVESMKVYNSLKKNDLNDARKQLSMLVGRQTENLSEEEIVRGAVETVAENTVDGIISPMFYALIGSLFGLGAPLAYAFKAASTLDSMVGYKNDKYLYFGRVSARTDDVLNYIPARLSGLIIPLSALFGGKSFTQSYKTMLRDRKNHKSPNCAYPEAAVAGALGVRLGGANVYFGKVVEKPTIGDPVKNLEAKDITDTIKIMYAASLLTLSAGTLIWFIIMYLFR